MLTLLLADRKYRVAAVAADDDDDAANDANKNGQDEKEDMSYNHVSDYAPFYEVDAHWEPVEQQQQQQDTSSPKTVRRLAAWIRKNHDRLGRRVFNTHLRWDMLPKKREVGNQDDNDSHEDKQSAEKVSDDISSINEQRPQCGKFIYITRNQIDVVASFYHHLSNQKEGTYTNSFDTFVYDWMRGTKIPFGSSLHHLISFAVGFADNSYARGDDDAHHTTSTSSNSINSNSTKDNDDDQPLLLLSYENMKSNLRNEILRIMTFLHLTNIPIDVLDTDILPSFTFNAMKNDIEKFQPKSVGWLNGFQFLRRGVSGDGRMLMMNDRGGVGGGSDTDNDGEEEGSSKLMDEYNEWIKKEEYCSKIENILHGPSLKECREVFLSVV